MRHCTPNSHAELSVRRRPAALAARMLCLLAAGPVVAQTAAPIGATDPAETLVITGMRASLMRAQDIKKNADQIVDSIVADDIGKLPDANVAEALQRIAGVQISRNRGEGDRVQVRGLSQTQTLLNGRAVFTAGKERGLSFQDMPAELLAGADVYKTPTADQVEGGIGGIIDLRTRRPFDFSGQKIAGTLKSTYADLARKQHLEGSVLLSNRWDLDGQQFGALLSVAHQARSYRADTQELSAPAQLADGSGIYAPTGVWYSYESGERQRTGVAASLQYRPSQSLEFALDASRTSLKTRTDTYGFYGSPYWANYSASTNLGALWPVADSIEAKDMRLQKGSFWGATMGPTSYIADNETVTSQVGLQARWQWEQWKLKGDVGRTSSTFSRLYEDAGLGAYTNNAQFAYDLNSELPSAYPVLAQPGDLTSAAQYWANKTLYFRQDNEGKENTLRLDAERGLAGTGFSRLLTGVRLAQRKATSAEINTIDNLWTGGQAGAVSGAVPALDQRIGAIPHDNLLSRAGSGSVVRQWLAMTDLDWLRDPAAFRAAFGLSVPQADPAQTFNYQEKTTAAYGVLDIDTEWAGRPLTGNLGLRYVQTRTDRQYTAATDAGLVPASSHDRGHDLLPSLNLRVALSGKLLLRAAASKVLTRPNFDQLTPSLSLNINDKTGYQGNPALGALKATQVDSALEYYISKSDHVYGAVFHKMVDGFIQTRMRALSYAGNTYTVATPSNGEDGRITGLEIGYQGFFTGLPGPLRGLGLQANYTRVNSSAPGPLGGQRAALEGLSRDSVNIVGMYDYEGLALRLAYNHRSSYLAGTSNYYPNNGNSIDQTPVYMQRYGILDAYASYALKKQLKLALEINNITRTVRRSSYGLLDMPRAVYADDRRIGLSLHAEL